jgi:hypothetical protein
MARTTRVCRAPNREPVSLAATTAVLGVVDAVDTIEPPTLPPPTLLPLTLLPLTLLPLTLLPLTLLPLTLLPPTPPPALNNYPPFDTEFDEGYIYPSPQPSPSLPTIRSRELTIRFVEVKEGINNLIEIASYC